MECKHLRARRVRRALNLHLVTTAALLARNCSGHLWFRRELDDTWETESNVENLSCCYLESGSISVRRFWQPFLPPVESILNLLHKDVLKGAAACSFSCLPGEEKLGEYVGVSSTMNSPRPLNPSVSVFRGKVRPFESIYSSGICFRDQRRMLWYFL